MPSPTSRWQLKRQLSAPAAAMADGAHAVPLPAWRHLITSRPGPRTVPSTDAAIDELWRRLDEERFYVLAWVMEYPGSNIRDKIRRIMQFVDEWRSHDLLLGQITVARMAWGQSPPPPSATLQERELDAERVRRWEVHYRDNVLPILEEARSSRVSSWLHLAV